MTYVVLLRRKTIQNHIGSLVLNGFTTQYIYIYTKPPYVTNPPSTRGVSVVLQRGLPEVTVEKPPDLVITYHLVERRRGCDPWSHW